jgi:hypothetical protein
MTLTALETEMLEALKAARNDLTLWRIETRKSPSLTLVQRAIRHAQQRNKFCGKVICEEAGASGEFYSSCGLKPGHKGKCKVKIKGEKCGLTFACTLKPDHKGKCKPRAA